MQESELALQRLASGLGELTTMKSDLAQYVAAGDSALLEQQLEQLHSQWEELCTKVSVQRWEKEREKWREGKSSLTGALVVTSRTKPMHNWQHTHTLTRSHALPCAGGEKYLHFLTSFQMTVIPEQPPEPIRQSRLFYGFSHTHTAQIPTVKHFDLSTNALLFLTTVQQLCTVLPVIGIMG